MSRLARISILERTEQSQALARFIIVSIVAVYTGGIVLFTAQPPELARIAISAATYCPIAGVWWYYVRREPLPFEQAAWRIYAGIFADTTMVGIFIAIGGADMLAIYVIYLWIILGNGMRFGANMMSAATAASVISLSVAAMVSPVWVLPPISTVVFILGLLIVDVFARRLIHERDRAQQLATRLTNELNEAQTGGYGDGFFSPSAFMDSVDEQLAALEDGGLLTAIVVAYSGDKAPTLGNPYSPLGRQLREVVASELRASDIATIGADDELLLFIQPKRLNDALAVAERVRKAFRALDSGLRTHVGVAAYPMIATDAAGLFDAARQNLAGGMKADARRPHLVVVEDWAD